MNEPATLESALAQDFIRQFPDEAARILRPLAPADIGAVLEGCGANDGKAVLGRLPPDTAGRVLVSLPDAKAGELVVAMDPPQASRALTSLDPDPREALLAVLPKGNARELRELAAYPPGTAGALMDPQVLSMTADATVRETLAKLRDRVQKGVYRVYVIDPTGGLLGSVRVRELAVADPDARLEALMLPGPAAVPSTATREDVSAILDRERVASLPVVDIGGRLLGVLRYDALIDATRDEAAGDILSMVGAGKEERALSKVSFAVRKRLPWLQVNLLTAFLAASVVGVFESTIARFTALAVLLPVVAGQSGNTGAQALAVTMRGLALREIRARQWLRVCWKEANVGLINGCAVALTTSLAVLVWSRSVGLALVIGLSMIVSMVAAGFSGAATPMVLTALGQDPAQSSSIILTTVTDIVGFFSFLGLATLLAGLL